MSDRFIAALFISVALVVTGRRPHLRLRTPQTRTRTRNLQHPPPTNSNPRISTPSSSTPSPTPWNLNPNPEERALSRETAIDLTLRTFDAKCHDINTYFNAKSLARSTRKLAQAKAEQEHWKYYKSCKRIAAKQRAEQVEGVPDPQELAPGDFAGPGSNVAEPAESRMGGRRLGTGMPWIPEGERGACPVLVGGSATGSGRGRGRDGGVVDMVNDWMRNVPTVQLPDDDEDDRRTNFTL
jgi:hypothetical protein